MCYQHCRLAARKETEIKVKIKNLKKGKSKKKQTNQNVRQKEIKFNGLCSKRTTKTKKATLN